MNPIRFFAAILPTDDEQVGGKGASLARMARATLPVPPGFCITADAYRQVRGKLNDDALIQAIHSAYRELGGGPVAVRSSATSEDGAETSFAGQQETILGVEGETALREAIQRCWDSLHSERATAYRQRQGIADESVAMAVVVQRLVPALVAGVLFTRDPLDASGQRMLVEASWGLGESVVSGRVTPDRFHVERATGRVLDRHLGEKSEQVIGGQIVPVPVEVRQRFCLNDAELAELAALGRTVEQFYGDPRDIEWAWAEGKFWLLQARPITTALASDQEALRTRIIESIRAGLTDPKKTAWVRYNLAEILPEPTPMTWAIVQRMLAVNGGMGAMNRDLGASPDPTLGDVGIYDLIAGRPYANLARMPRMQFRNPPFVYPIAEYHQNPALALEPRPRMKLFTGIGSLFTFPFRLAKLFGSSMKTQKLADSFAKRFREEIIPAFVRETDVATTEDWTGFSPDELRSRLNHWIERTLVEFARESLKPTVFADMGWQVVYQGLKRTLGDEGARAALGELTLGARPDADADLPGAIRAVSKGQLDHRTFLQRFGHRGNHEMELAQPRWNEDPTALDRLLDGVPRTDELISADWELRWERIANEAKINSLLRPHLKLNIAQARTYLGLREAGKHYLMRGYALIRRALVLLDRHYRLDGGIFYLHPDELDTLPGDSKAVTHLIQTRRRERAAELAIEVPTVLFGDDLEAIGRPAPLPDGDHLHGVALSSGVAEGETLVLTEPSREIPNEPYVLVCPSTDPAWVPLFARAKALIMETGGVLSHGAIVAREFGLPAIAGLPGVVQRLRTGQRVRVDGGRGTVTILR